LNTLFIFTGIPESFRDAFFILIRGHFLMMLRIIKKWEEFAGLRPAPGIDFALHPEFELSCTRNSPCTRNLNGCKTLLQNKNPDLISILTLPVLSGVMR
jgi:hypothetical protein